MTPFLKHCSLAVILDRNDFSKAFDPITNSYSFDNLFRDQKFGLIFVDYSKVYYVVKPLLNQKRFNYFSKLVSLKLYIVF